MAWRGEAARAIEFVEKAASIDTAPVRAKHDAEFSPSRSPDSRFPESFFFPDWEKGANSREETKRTKRAGFGRRTEGSKRESAPVGKEEKGARTRHDAARNVARGIETRESSRGLFRGIFLGKGSTRARATELARAEAAFFFSRPRCNVVWSR